MPAFRDPALVSRGEPEFDAARQRLIWNKRLALARTPDAIVDCRSAADVRSAIGLARDGGQRVSPCGGGHHYEAAALREGGFLLDLAGLDFVEIDAETRVARVGAGVRGGDLTEKLAAKGFGFPVGHCVDVGLSGYLLAGGLGWNAGEWGAACGGVVAVEVVTAAGELVLANATQHADLWWAARGHGAGFFAAVTAFHLALQPLPPAVWAWRAMFPLASAPLLADWINAAIAAADPAVELGCFVLHAPDSGQPAVIVRVSACGETADDARTKLASFASPPAVERLWEPKGEALAFTELPRLSPMPAGKRVAADHLWSDNPVGDLLLAIYHLVPPSADSTVDLVAYGGNAPVAVPGDAALSRIGRTGAGIYALWDEPADDALNRNWVSQIDDALAPFRTGRYVGEADLGAAPDRRAQCFGPGVLDRLAAIRTAYDPDEVFFGYP
ncbi:MAG: FAD-binding oxidoreductase [Croceibacterium sp.]